MKKLIALGVASIALFAVTTVVRAADTGDVGFENIFQNVSVDLKVNGQDGPVTVERGSRIVVSWVSDSATRCRGNWSKNDIKTSGTVSGKISKSIVIKAACIDADGNRDDDSVVVNVSGGAAINQPVPVSVPATSAQPNINYVSPSSGKTNDKIGIYGVNLIDTTPSGIRIELLQEGSVKGTINSGYIHLSSEEVSPKGSYLTFTLPGLLVDNIASGTYQIRVVNDKGTSNVANFTITTPTTSAQPKTYTLTTSVTGAGTVSGKGGVNCGYGIGSSCSTTFTSGTQVTLSASPYTGYILSEWGGACLKASTGGVGDCTIVMDADKSVSVTFTTQTSQTTASSVTATPPSLSATAPTITGTRTTTGDKLYPGSMSITATVSNSGGALTSPVSARFQFSTNNVNWYDFIEVGPISTTPNNVSHTWDGGSGYFCFRLAIGTGTDNVSPSSCIDIVPKEGAFIGLSRELAGVAVPSSDSVPSDSVWGFLKAFFWGK